MDLWAGIVTGMLKDTSWCQHIQQHTRDRYKDDVRRRLEIEINSLCGWNSMLLKLRQSMQQLMRAGFNLACKTGTGLRTNLCLCLFSSSFQMMNEFQMLKNWKRSKQYKGKATTNAILVIHARPTSKNSDTCTSGDKPCTQPATIESLKSLKPFLHTLQAHS